MINYVLAATLWALPKAFTLSNFYLRKEKAKGIPNFAAEGGGGKNNILNPSAAGNLAFRFAIVTL